MPTKIIVSYDGTDNDTDALALGRALSHAGATLALAYVRHHAEPDVPQERLAQHEAEELLEGGARWLGEPDIERHVVLSASTPEGLADLAKRLNAAAIVFGSEYRTSPGAVQPQTSAQHLLEGAQVAIGIAPAGLRDVADFQIQTVAAVSEPGDPSAEETGQALAGRLGATLAARPGPAVDLIVITSRVGASPGHVTISAAAQYVIDTARSSVLVLPAQTPMLFAAGG